MFRTALMLLLLTTILASPPARAEGVPGLLPVQGMLFDDEGAPVDEPVSVVFSLYEDVDAETFFFSETRVVDVDLGVFSTYLGETAALSMTEFRDRAEIWLGVAVGGDDEMDRVQLAPTAFAGFAHFADDAATVGGMTPDDLTSWDNVTDLPGDAALRTEDEVKALARLACFDTLSEIRAVDGTDSGLDADLLDNHEGSWYLDAGNLTSGELPTDRFDAYADLAASGMLDGAGDGSLATRGAQDLRYLAIDGQATDSGQLGGEQPSYYRDADHLNAGTVATDRYSARDDLTAEGHLTGSDAGDLLTFADADERYVDRTSPADLPFGLSIGDREISPEQQPDQALWVTGRATEWAPDESVPLGQSPATATLVVDTREGPDRYLMSIGAGEIDSNKPLFLNGNTGSRVHIGSLSEPETDLTVHGSLDWQCPSGTTQVGTWCMDTLRTRETIRSEATLGCHNRGLDLCSAEAVLNCRSLFSGDDGVDCSQDVAELNSVHTDSYLFLLGEGDVFTDAVPLILDPNGAREAAADTDGVYYCCSPVSAR